MRYPKATWSGPIPNEEHAGMVKPIRGLVLHIEQGPESAADAWFHNPKAQASAHFGNPKSGPLVQWVDTDDEAWAEMAGNSRWISVEHEGYSGESLTPSQIENDARLYAWLHQHYGVPLRSTDNPYGSGLGWHGMGGAAWGGHLLCPGDPIKAERPLILARARELLTPKPVKVLLSLKAIIAHPIAAALKIKPRPFIADHPAGGKALVNLAQNLWQGIPDQVELIHLQAAGVKPGKVAASFWTHAKQVPWQ